MIFVFDLHGSGEWWLHGAGALSSGEEIPLVQGEEQRLCFAGAAVKRYPMSTLKETT